MSNIELILKIMYPKESGVTLVDNSGTGIKYVGSDEHVSHAKAVKKLYDNTWMKLYTEFENFYGREFYADHPKKFFGVFLPEENGNRAAATTWYPGDPNEKRELVTVILNMETYKQLHETFPQLLELYLLHEMVHERNRIVSEQKTYELVSDFYHHMAFISYGYNRKIYKALAVIADQLLEQYEQNPYQAVEGALKYVESQLLMDDLSPEEISELKECRTYLKSKKDELNTIDDKVDDEASESEKKPESKKTIEYQQNKSNSAGSDEDSNNESDDQPLDEEVESSEDESGESADAA